MKKYEEDMTVFYDPVSKSVVVVFRGKTTLLAGPFPDQRSGIAAGERLCEELGWATEERKIGLS